jgi:hypothetical protein
MGIISLPSAIYLGIEKFGHPTKTKERLATSLLKGLIMLSVLWAPICYLLAGNISFSFSAKDQFQGGQSAMKLFWYFNYFVTSAPIVILIVYGIWSLLKKIKRSSNKH